MILELSILTFNIWCANIKINKIKISIKKRFTIISRGIPIVSKDRQIRVDAIGKRLAESSYDVVSLQEVWSTDDFEQIRERTKYVLPYSHYFHRYYWQNKNKLRLFYHH